MRKISFLLLTLLLAACATAGNSNNEVEKPEGVAFFFLGLGMEEYVRNPDGSEVCVSGYSLDDEGEYSLFFTCDGRKISRSEVVVPEELNLSTSEILDRYDVVCAPDVLDCD